MEEELQKLQPPQHSSPTRQNTRGQQQLPSLSDEQQENNRIRIISISVEFEFIIYKPPLQKKFLIYNMHEKQTLFAIAKKIHVMYNYGGG